MGKHEERKEEQVIWISGATGKAGEWKSIPQKGIPVQNRANTNT
jgi:hypothetical protein